MHFCLIRAQAAAGAVVVSGVAFSFIWRVLRVDPLKPEDGNKKPTAFGWRWVFEERPLSEIRTSNHRPGLGPRRQSKSPWRGSAGRPVWRRWYERGSSEAA